MNVVIKSIPADQHRYNTTGDYWTEPDGTEQIRVTQQKDWRFEFLVALHEFVETYLCKAVGVAEPDVLQFDLEFEKELERGEHPDQYQPGDDPRAPYFKQHQHATNVESYVCEALGLNWEEYNNSFE